MFCRTIFLHFAILPLVGHKNLVNDACLNVTQFFCALQQCKKLTRKHNQCGVVSCERARQENEKPLCKSLYLWAAAAHFLSISSAQTKTEKVCNVRLRFEMRLERVPLDQRGLKDEIP